MSTPEKKADGYWHVDIRPHGKHGYRTRRRFKSKTEANQYIQYCFAKAAENKEWIPTQKDDPRRLSQLIEIWYDSTGHTLSDGVRCKQRCLDFANFFGDIQAKKLTPEHWIKYSKSRLKAGIKPKTVNNMLGYIKAVYNHLNEIEVIDYQNPIAKVKKIRLQQNELAYLTSEQIDLLLTTINGYNKNPHVYLITKICLATAARWGEAQSLEPRHVKNNSVTYIDTKNKKTRTIPVERKLFLEIKEHFLKYPNGFGESAESFRRALKKTGISLPEGQSTHVLRHTFASHFMMNGGNILALQRILDHAHLTTTMKYAHLAPDYLQEAVNLNPLSNTILSETSEKNGKKESKKLN